MAVLHSQEMDGLPKSSFIKFLLNFYDTKPQKDLSEKIAGLLGDLIVYSLAM